VVKFLGDENESKRLRIIRKVDKRVCEESGGVYIEKDKICIMEVHEDEKGLHIKKPNVDLVDLEDERV